MVVLEVKLQPWNKAVIFRRKNNMGYMQCPKHGASTGRITSPLIADCIRNNVLLNKSTLKTIQLKLDGLDSYDRCVFDDAFLKQYDIYVPQLDIHYDTNSEHRRFIDNCDYTCRSCLKESLEKIGYLDR